MFSWITRQELVKLCWYDAYWNSLKDIFQDISLRKKERQEQNKLDISASHFIGWITTYGYGFLVNANFLYAVYKVCEGTGCRYQ